MSDLSYDYLCGIYPAMHEKMPTGKYLQADETPIEYLDFGGGKTKQGDLWTLSSPDLKKNRWPRRHPPPMARQSRRHLP